MVFEVSYRPFGISGDYEDDATLLRENYIS